MNDCATCRPRLKAIERDRIFPCPESHADWFPMNIVEECFCRHHILWLILHREVLADGRYPPQHSGYVPQPGYSASLPQSAPFERVTQLYTQLDIRLRRTGEDGQTLIEEVESGLNMESLSRVACRALGYISGPKEKTQTYAEWKYEQKRGGLELSEPCRKCGSNRWKTIKKGEMWRCRKCREVRRITA